MAPELEEDKTMMGKALKATMSMKSCSKLKLKNQNLKESKFQKRIVLLLQSYPEVKKKIKLFKNKNFWSTSCQLKIQLGVNNSKTL